MDSLLATYASSDEDGDETLPSPAPAPAPAAAKPPGGIFSALPQPKSAPIFSSLPAPRSGPTFSSIPPPRSSAAAASSGNPKRVVQFRPPPIHQPTGASSDEEDDADKRRPSASVAPPPSSAGSGPVSSFLPAPKHSLGFGSGAARRSAVDTAGPERSNLGSAGPSSSAVNTGAPERPNTGAAAEDSPDESSDEDGMPDPGQQLEQQGLDAGAGDQQQQAYDAGVGSATPYDGYAWDQNQNYYANYAGNYGSDPSGNVNYGTEPQYAAYGVEQGAVYGGEQSGGYGYSTAPPDGTEYTGAYRHEVAEMAAPPMQEPVLPPEMGRIGGKRGRRDVPMEILEVNQAELMKNRPREDKSKLTGLAFGPSYQAAPSGKGKPSKLAKRKHQIGSLYFDMRAKEMELNERRSKGVLTKAETQAKYGW